MSGFIISNLYNSVEFLFTGLSPIIFVFSKAFILFFISMGQLFYYVFSWLDSILETTQISSV